MVKEEDDRLTPPTNPTGFLELGGGDDEEDYSEEEFEEDIDEEDGEDYDDEDSADLELDCSTSSLRMSKEKEKEKEPTSPARSDSNGVSVVAAGPIYLGACTMVSCTRDTDIVYGGCRAEAAAGAASVCSAGLHSFAPTVPLFAGSVADMLAAAGKHLEQHGAGCPFRVGWRR